MSTPFKSLRVRRALRALGFRDCHSKSVEGARMTNGDGVRVDVHVLRHREVQLAEIKLIGRMLETQGVVRKRDEFLSLVRRS